VFKGLIATSGFFLMGFWTIVLKSSEIGSLQQALPLSTVGCFSNSRFFSLKFLLQAEARCAEPNLDAPFMISVREQDSVIRLAIGMSSFAGPQENSEHLPLAGRA